VIIFQVPPSSLMTNPNAVQTIGGFTTEWPTPLLPGFEPRPFDYSGGAQSPKTLTTASDILITQATLRSRGRSHI
jgi:hypothetical protein